MRQQLRQQKSESKTPNCTRATKKSPHGTHQDTMTISIEQIKTPFNEKISLLAHQPFLIPQRVFSSSIKNHLLLKFQT